MIKNSFQLLDCKTVGFFLKISKEIGNAWRKSLMRANIASLPSLALCFQPLTARAYLNTQKYGLFCSLFSSNNVDWEMESKGI